MTLVKDNPLGYGLLGGIGLNVVMGKWELMLEGGATISVTATLCATVPSMRAIRCVRRPRQHQPVARFFYRLGDKPHTRRRPGMHASSPKGGQRAQRESWREMKKTEETAGIGE